MRFNPFDHSNTCGEIVGRIVVVAVLPALVILGMPLNAFAFGSPGCGSTTCTYNGGGSSGGSGASGSGSGNGGSYTPFYPPTESICVDQGGYIRPYSINSNLTITCTRDVGKTVGQSRQL